MSNLCTSNTTGIPMHTYHQTSLLLGSREEFRLGEKIGVLLTPVLKPFLIGSLKKYRPVEAESVAHFMVKVAHEELVSGIHVYESDLIG